MWTTNVGECITWWSFNNAKMIYFCLESDKMVKNGKNKQHGECTSGKFGEKLQKSLNFFDLGIVFFVEKCYNVNVSLITDSLILVYQNSVRILPSFTFPCNSDPSI